MVSVDSHGHTSTTRVDSPNLSTVVWDNSDPRYGVSLPPNMTTSVSPELRLNSVALCPHLALRLGTLTCMHMEAHDSSDHHAMIIPLRFPPLPTHTKTHKHNTQTHTEDMDSAQHMESHNNTVLQQKDPGTYKCARLVGFCFTQVTEEVGTIFTAQHPWNMKLER